MGFKEQTYRILAPIKATRFLLNQGYNTAQAQKILDKSRLRQNNKVIRKRDILDIGSAKLLEFVPESSHLAPICIVRNGILRQGNTTKCIYPNFTYKKQYIRFIKRAMQIHSLNIDRKKKRMYNTIKNINISNNYNFKNLKYSKMNRDNQALYHSLPPLFNELSELHFCVFNKPPKLLTHPKKLNNAPSLLDALRFHFNKECNPCHRLDYETSGLVLCSLDKKSEIIIKNLFAQKVIHKEYYAIVQGKITQPLLIQSDIIFDKKFGNLCIKGKTQNLCMQTFKRNETTRLIRTLKKQNNAITLILPLKVFSNFSCFKTFLQSKQMQQIFADSLPRPSMMPKDSKMQLYSNHIWTKIFTMSYPHLIESLLHYVPLMQTYQFDIEPSFLSHFYHQNLIHAYKHFIIDSFAYNAKLYEAMGISFVKLLPITGKTHQLRLHTSSIGHAILGDTLYGVNESVASLFLDMRNKEVVFHKAFIVLKRLKCNKRLLSANTQMMLNTRTISFNLSTLLSPCFHGLNLFDEKECAVFWNFLHFLHALPHHYDEILQDMSEYYAKSVRLLLHASSIKLGNVFECP